MDKKFVALMALTLMICFWPSIVVADRGGSHNYHFDLEVMDDTYDIGQSGYVKLIGLGHSKDPSCPYEYQLILRLKV